MISFTHDLRLINGCCKKFKRAWLWGHSHLEILNHKIYLGKNEITYCPFCGEPIEVNFVEE